MRALARAWLSATSYVLILTAFVLFTVATAVSG